MDSNPRVIGLVGKLQSGKSSAARFLVDVYDYKRIRFAQSLKDMARCIGLTENQVDGDMKEIPLDLICGKTPRYFLQTLGTEFGRNLIGPDLWTNITEHKIREHLAKNSLYRIVVDDIRFPNEINMIEKLGGRVIRIIRTGQISKDIHASETALDHIVLDTAEAESGRLDLLAIEIERILKL